MLVPAGPFSVEKSASSKRLSLSQKVRGSKNMFVSEKGFLITRRSNRKTVIVPNFFPRVVPLRLEFASFGGWYGVWRKFNPFCNRDNYWARRGPGARNRSLQSHGNT